LNNPDLRIYTLKMDKDSIYKTLQEICRQVPIVILGSGVCEEEHFGDKII